MQSFKTVYFPDSASQMAPKRALTLAFGKDDDEVYRHVAYLSSVRLRELLGYNTLADLERDALRSGQPVNALCRSVLRAALEPALGGRASFRDGLQATFSGGRDQPLQNWYPYLEGYSPDFVREILATYAPEAQHVLDPFAGSGTTPLTVMAAGGIGYYSDVNPLCSFLIETKAAARSAVARDRLALAAELDGIAALGPTSFLRCGPDSDLHLAYPRVFGDSKFFDAAHLEQILRVRSFIDDVQQPLLRSLCAVAAIRSLIPASRLIRRGDLRFKNASELARPSVQFTEAFRASLELLASDLRQLESTDGSVVMVGESALQTTYSRVFDAIVTSPPYLNGTNYFRNTKVELWFLRLLRSKEQLRVYRHQAVTAGINDVTRAKTASRTGRFTSNLLVETVGAITRSAYDTRIPAMVETYFNDLHEVVARMWPSLREGGVLALDIGDSAYAGVHVPTDRLLSEIVQSLGGEAIDDITLRERASRDGGRLRQCLLVFRKL